METANAMEVVDELNPETSRLLLLPFEIIIVVAELLVPSSDSPRGKAGLLNLRLTCKQFAQICEPILYRSIQLYTDFDASDHNHHLNQHPERCTFTDILTISFRTGESPTRALECAGDRADGGEGNILLDQVPTCLDRFSNVKNLRIHTGSTSETVSLDWHQSLQRALDVLPFMLLKECYLGLWTTTLDSFHWKLNIARLMQAPRLATLCLRCVDLTGHMDKKGRGRHMSALKSLSLLGCKTDDTSLAAIVGAPKCLRDFEYGRDTLSPEPLLLWGSRPETVELQRVIIILTKLQLCLQRLTIRLTTAPSNLSESYRNVLDLTGLKSLQHVCFRGKMTGGSNVSNRTPWLPLAPFEKLPLCESIDIRTKDFLPIDLMAYSMLKPTFWGGCIPASVRRLDFLTYTPFHRDKAEQEKAIREGLKLFVCELGVPTASYSYHGVTSKRTLTAEKSDDAGGQDCKFTEKMIHFSDNLQWLKKHKGMA
jgi:hypothetical protein